MKEAPLSPGPPCEFAVALLFTVDRGLGRAKVRDEQIHARHGIMAADTISGYIQGLLDGKDFKQTAYALDRDSRKAAPTRFLRKAAGEDESEGGWELRPAA